MKTVIIQTSARLEGNTKDVALFLKAKKGYDIIDLADKKINQFNYENLNQQDDFLPLIRDIVDRYDTIIFATPVYWYSMSGHLKVFLDRFSDLLHGHKAVGRSIRGKRMAVISNNGSDDIFEGFDIPFIKRAAYLGMDYLGYLHTWTSPDGITDTIKEQLLAFVAKLDN